MRRLLLLPLLALTLVPAALSAPRGQTISGTITANSGASITVTSGDRSVTCTVLGAKAQAAISRWGVGVKAGMACREAGARLVLAKLSRTGSTEHPPTTTTPTTTTEPTAAPPTPPPAARRDARGTVSALGGGTITVTRDGGTSLTCSVTDGQARSIGEGAPVGTAVLIVCSGDGDRPALVDLTRLTSAAPPVTPPTTPPAPAPVKRYAKGIVSQLSSDAVTVTPDDGTEPVRCRITAAADSTAAAAKLSLGAHVGIVCRLDGTSFVLFGSTPVA